MPYFKTPNFEILLIHIPKTGGSSVEYYLSKKFNIPLNQQSLYEIMSEKIIENNHLTIESCVNSIMQHMTFKTITENNHYFKINLNNNPNLTIITVVRNPYERMISYLFFSSRIFKHTPKEQVFKEINCLMKTINTYNQPQCVFIKDCDNNIISNIKILKTETLNNDMYKLGFEDFNLFINKNRCGITKENYYDYLNDDAIAFINDFYNDDFELFGYKKILLSR